jgi:hypothetical protein
MELPDAADFEMLIGLIQKRLSREGKPFENRIKPEFFNPISKG